MKKHVYIVDKEKEAADFLLMKQCGQIMQLKNTIKKIKNHGKVKKSK